MTQIPKINDAIIKMLCGYLLDRYGNYYTYEGFNNEIIEIMAFSLNDESDKNSIIRIGIQNDFKKIYISNILTPPLLKYNGVGKKLIRLVYEIGFSYGYDTFVVLLTDNFMKKLLKRGAVTTNVYDTLQIVETTNLLDIYIQNSVD